MKGLYRLLVCSTFLVFALTSVSFAHGKSPTKESKISIFNADVNVLENAILLNVLEVPAGTISKPVAEAVNPAIPAKVVKPVFAAYFYRNALFYRLSYAKDVSKSKQNRKNLYRRLGSDYTYRC